jgi:carbamoyl-phosphate synthase small subunit
MTKTLKAILAFPNGDVFYGTGIGKPGTTFGEICFNTSITGYQEILTDPSYSGQIITFTFPHIGNVGTNAEDIEAQTPLAKGLIVRADITNPSNYRSAQHFNEWLIKNNITGICGVDTRAITRKIRLTGAPNVAIGVGDYSEAEIITLAKQHPDLNGQELTLPATTKKANAWKNGGLWKKQTPKAKYKVAALDYGIKENILRNLAQQGFDVTLYPANTPAADILKTAPDGVFLSNGPGDPAATAKFAVPIIKDLVASGLPIFGICMGHQLLATALGCTTQKMHQGHRGANHPIKDLETGKVEITSQNHGFVVSEDLAKGVTVTHRSLFDGTIAGIKFGNTFSVQYHPEASPGPHDSHYLFERFVALVENHKKKAA